MQQPALNADSRDCWAARAIAAVRRRGGLRSALAVAALAALLGAAGCGGGGDDGNSSVTFGVGVLIGGQPVSGGQVQPGGNQTIYVPVGQSIELDASEPVVWTLQVGGIAIAGSGTTVYYAGAYITETALSSSRIAIDTAAPQPLQAYVPMTLTATSTYDSALIATVNVLITN